MQSAGRELTNHMRRWVRVPVWLSPAGQARLVVYINKIFSSSQPDKEHTFVAEARESRTHLFRIRGTHAALKAGRDTGPHPPPLKTRLKIKKYKLQNTKTYTLYLYTLYLYTSLPLCPYTTPGLSSVWQSVYTWRVWLRSYKPDE